MNQEQCGCCEGTEVLTPLATANRPGLDALSYRVGTHATFLETMKARLSSGQYPALTGLTTRNADDPAIALLDAWSTIAHVLTFYQERIANEGYLPTATERRSILELARLIGYRLRPGVAANTFLAFTLDEGYEVKIPERTLAQSLPAPGELPQPFETMEPLLARAAWNALKPRPSHPQIMTDATHTVYLEGLGIDLKPHAPAVVVASTETGEPDPIFLRVHSVEPEEAEKRTKVLLIGELKVDELETALAIKPQVLIRNPPENPTPAHEATVPIPEPILELSWEVLDASPQATYKVEFGTGDPLGVLADDLEEPSYTLTEEEMGLLQPDTPYYWTVTVTDGTSTLHGPIWNFTTKKQEEEEEEEEPDNNEGDSDNGGARILQTGDEGAAPEPKPQPDSDQDDLREAAANDLVDSILNRLSDGSETRPQSLPLTLRDLTLSADRLEREIWIEKEPLEPAHDIIEDLASIQPSARDFSAVAAWLKGLKAILENITQQLGLRRAVPSTPGGPFEGRFIDQEQVFKLIDHWRRGEEEIVSPGDDEHGAVGREFNLVLDKTEEILNRLLAGEEEKEEKIVAVEGQIYRVTDLLKVFEKLWPDEDATQWLRKLRDTLKETLKDEPPGETALPSLRPLLIPPSRPPANALKLARTVHDVFAPDADIAPRLLTTLQRQLQGTFYQAWAGAEPVPLSPLQGFEALRLKVTPFGAKAPLKPIYNEKGVVVDHQEWLLLGISLRISFEKFSQGTYHAPIQVQVSLTRDTHTWQGAITVDASNPYATLFVQEVPVQVRLRLAPGGDGRAIDEIRIDILDTSNAIRLTEPAKGKNGVLSVTVADAFLEEDYHYIFSADESRIATVNMSQVKITNASDSDKPFFSIEDLPIVMPEEMRRTLTLDGEYDIKPGSWVAVERPEVEKPRFRKLPPGFIIRPPFELDFPWPGIFLPWLGIIKGPEAVKRLEVIEQPEVSAEPKDGNEFKDEDPTLLVRRVQEVRSVSKPGYGQVTQLTLDKAWLSKADVSLSSLREITIYAQSQRLALAEEPITTDVEGNKIQLDGIYEGLEAGRWLIVSGERTDVPGTSGLPASELVMLAGVTQSREPGTDDAGQPPGEEAGVSDQRQGKAYTTIHLARDLNYTYQRDTVTIYGNVVKATHGETRREVLGSGDGSQAMQSFSLGQSPLTYLAAPTPAGAQSTLEVWVDDIRWHETESLGWLEANDRKYITRTDNDDNTTIIFGDGQRGARPPTGIENIEAVYRTGIGKGGNVAAEQISLLATRPLGVKAVINPMPASGGADREDTDQGRRNAPLAVMALDRLVSIQDYADFARTYAGISKASAVRLSDGRQQVIHLTVAGVDDVPIDQGSDLYKNLCQALLGFGPPHQAILVSPRELMLLIISADVRLLPDRRWESVAPDIRHALLNTFSFERRQLGQHVLLSEAIYTIQQVPGVAYVDVDILDSVSENIPPTELEDLANELTRAKERIVVNLGRCQSSHEIQRSNETLSSIAQRYGISEVELRQLNLGIQDLKIGMALDIPRQIRPAQIAYLSPEVPDMLILRELT
jgi:hypothetical protein